DYYCCSYAGRYLF
nr:immunoglobulin light chain junction region [Macaca mulatta]MOV72940.1 immunoglobulin light chain junction region [Macaca mulatta]MOV73297.1 immunoglobulin light chain junction region [Macaca mulatta]MOV73659.1 immunoglobulin light chain junction region [Macaca mulatta]MOW29415.1 immunoglobulin light chain junction region [Macaca mulatta]